MAKEKKKTGRPSKLNTISLKQVNKLAAYALTDEQIADVLEICKASLNNYKTNPEFLDSLNSGKQKADNYVVGSLFHRAIGYNHPEIITYCYRGKIITAKVMKHYPPDTLACMYWLKNRQPDKWRDKTEVEHAFKDFLFDDFTSLTPEDLEKMANELRQKRSAAGSKNRERTGLQEKG